VAAVVVVTVAVAVDDVIFPREIPLPQGMPDGWKAIEKVYGLTARTQGTYVRYNSIQYIIL
jgi:hypothetical protein